MKWSGDHGSTYKVALEKETFFLANRVEPGSEFEKAVNRKDQIGFKDLVNHTTDEVIKKKRGLDFLDWVRDMAKRAKLSM